jgi:hypothetical protein
MSHLPEYKIVDEPVGGHTYFIIDHDELEHIPENLRE